MKPGHKEVTVSRHENILIPPKGATEPIKRLGSKQCSIMFCIYLSDVSYGRIKLCNMHNKEIMDNLKLKKEEKVAPKEERKSTIKPRRNK